jgi:hypothetical protein
VNRQPATEAFTFGGIVESGDTDTHSDDIEKGALPLEKIGSRQQVIVTRETETKFD